MFPELPEYFLKRGMELWGRQVRFGISPIGKRQVYWFAVILSSSNQKDIPGETKNKLNELFTDFDPIVRELITSTPEHKIIRNDIFDLKSLKKWYKGHTCLIGDAAHATTPNMGQGGAQAVEDAYTLAQWLYKDPSLESFQNFQKVRENKVISVVKRSWMLGKIAHWKYGRSVRNAFLSAVTYRTTIRLRSLGRLYALSHCAGFGVCGAITQCRCYGVRCRGESIYQAGLFAVCAHARA